MELKIFVRGSRNWLSPVLIEQTIRGYLASEALAGRSYTRVILVHGACKGVDNMAGAIGKALGFEVRAYPAEAEGRVWPSAGIIRNGVMLEREHPCADGKFYDVAFLFHEKPSLGTGTKNMKERLDKADPPIPTHVIINRGR